MKKNTENIRAKLKRLVNQGILVETEPGLSLSHAPNPADNALTSPPSPRQRTKGSSTRAMLTENSIRHIGKRQA
ncbi:hypothetical protein ACGFNP_13515 [Nonomuraea sp. NPDC049269]|uniref:hypothetical protein n=1 Tax=Nonomuraea sp. NPDC049269 TaxID=3364349 RepID=UPI003720F436